MLRLGLKAVGGGSGKEGLREDAPPLIGGFLAPSTLRLR